MLLLVACRFLLLLVCAILLFLLLLHFFDLHSSIPIVIGAEQKESGSDGKLVESDLTVLELCPEHMTVSPAKRSGAPGTLVSAFESMLPTALNTVQEEPIQEEEEEQAAADGEAQGDAVVVSAQGERETIGSNTIQLDYDESFKEKRPLDAALESKYWEYTSVELAPFSPLRVCRASLLVQFLSLLTQSSFFLVFCPDGSLHHTSHRSREQGLSRSAVCPLHLQGTSSPLATSKAESLCGICALPFLIWILFLRALLLLPPLSLLFCTLLFLAS